MTATEPSFWAELRASNEPHVCRECGWDELPAADIYCDWCSIEANRNLRWINRVLYAAGLTAIADRY